MMVFAKKMFFKKGVKEMQIKKGLIKMVYPERIRNEFSDEIYRFDRIMGENLETILMAFFATIGAYPFVRDGQLEFGNWACINCSVPRFSRCLTTFGTMECFNNFLPNFFGAEHDWTGDFLTGLKRKI
jgi:hypothetical protein